jgi:hypothetical protein
MRGEAREARPFVAGELVRPVDAPLRPFAPVYKIRKVYARRGELELKLVGLKPPVARVVQLDLSDNPPRPFRAMASLFTHAR